ncbi:MAG: protein kinase [Planctomycetes bacterium]|nr:protein kinase [Planctomycetota bacterium]
MQGPQPSVFPRHTGGFRLVRELGRGGMGVVYEAQEVDSGRVVALKVLAAELSVSGEAFERFRREARLAAAISDARCVFVYGAHQVDGSPAIAMELVGGETLQDKIARGETISIETAVRWAIDVIDGLEAAHQAGVIHRDVKPSNCFVTTDGQVKIGDFGLSRTLERDIELTQSGQFLGSPLYASPEQIRGRTVDAKSDQYSCAATLYALLTGRAPFGGNNVGEVLARILSEAPARMRSLRPEIPTELERVVRRGMERDPDKRYRDLEAFRTALLPFSSSAAAAASIPRRFGAWVVDASILFFVSSSISTLLQTSKDLHPADLERPWRAIPLGTQLAMASLPIVYFALAEGLFAATIGKWLLGLRIAAVGPGPALWVRAIPRAFLYEAVALLLLIPLHFLPQDALTYALLSPLVPLGAVAFRLSTMRRRNGWRGPYELWTGTRVVQAQIPFRRVRRTTPPAESVPVRSAGLPERLGEYRVAGLVGETGSGALLAARDERLERSVWIQFRDSGAVASEARRSLSRPQRLRWLESLRTQGEVADVFESPGGTSLAALVARGEPLEWPMVERILAALAEELARCEQEAGAPLSWSPNQVWVDRNWRARLLDEPVPASPQDQDAVRLLGTTAQGLLGIGPDRALPPDLPVHAEGLVRALTGAAEPYRDLGAARAAIEACQSAPATVEVRARSAQLAVSTLILTLFTAFCLVLFLVVATFLPRAVELRGVLRELEAGRTAVSSEELKGRSAPPPSGPELDEQSRGWRYVLASYEASHGFGPNFTADFGSEEQTQIALARQFAPSPTVEECEAARAQILAQRGPGIVAEIEPFSSLPRAAFVPIFVALGTALWTLLAFLSALIWPGGLSFRLFGLSIRRRDGRRAGRPFGLLRTALFALPLTAAYAGSLPLLRVLPWAGWTLFAVAASLHAAGIVATILVPSRGPADRLLRSRIVPR